MENRKMEQDNESTDSLKNNDARPLLINVFISRLA